MNLRPSGYEPDELIFRKSLKTRNLRHHNGLAVLFHDHHVDHGDHDDHNLATFWLQWHECANEKSAHPVAACDLRDVPRCGSRTHSPPVAQQVSGAWGTGLSRLPNELESLTLLTAAVSRKSSGKCRFRSYRPWPGLPSASWRFLILRVPKTPSGVCRVSDGCRRVLSATIR